MENRTVFHVILMVITSFITVTAYNLINDVHYIPPTALQNQQSDSALFDIGSSMVSENKTMNDNTINQLLQ